MDWEGKRVPKINEIWMLACIKNSLKNKWFQKPKIKKITKNTIPETMHFLHAFLNRFWRCLGRVLGDIWDLLVVSWGTLSVFFQGFVAKRAQEGPRGGQEASWACFSMVLDRFWEGFGRPTRTNIRYVCYFFDLFFETWFWSNFVRFLMTSTGGWRTTLFSPSGVVGAFGGIWVENKMP